MSFKHGSQTEIWMNAADASTWLSEAELGVSQDTTDLSTFKATYKANGTGIKSGSFSAKGYFDYLKTAFRDSLGVAADPILTFGPGSMATLGDSARLMKVTLSSYGESIPIGGYVSFSWKVSSDGAIGFGNVLAPMAAKTTTSQNASFDGGASSAAGGIAHLHITAVSGTASPTLTVTLQDSADGSTGWATIAGGGSFTAATAVGAQEIILTGTVRRYVRAAWTISGTNPSFTFGVAFARL